MPEYLSAGPTRQSEALGPLLDGIDFGRLTQLCRAKTAATGREALDAPADRKGELRPLLSYPPRFS